jgi:RNA polymerase sigma-70 factor (ECF subfamily)
MNLKNSAYGNEELLVRTASKGDLDAFNQLVLIYQNKVYNHAYSLLSDSASAEDATQDCFIKAFQNISNFRGGSFQSWLLKIVTNSAYDILRRVSRHPIEPLFPVNDEGEEMEFPAWITDPTTSVQEIVEQHEEVEHIYEMLNELPVVYRSVITLIDIDELDYVEAARILNVPLGTVKSRLARARLQMMEKIKASRDYGRYLTHERIVS